MPLLLDALAKTSPPVCFIMPERLALADPATPIREAIGSGPYRYLAAERMPGARVAYERFAGYRPREEGAPEVTSGPKRASTERIEWRIIPDAATAGAALQANEVDWWEWPVPDLVPLLRRNLGIVVANVDPMGYLAAIRLNYLHPPFDDPAARRALLPAVAQGDFMAAVAGTDRGMWNDGAGIFPPESPISSKIGLASRAGPRDLAPARAALASKSAVVIGPSDYPNVQTLTEVTADLLRRVGMAVDYRPTDWSSVVQRRTNRNPAVHILLRANGTAAWPSWPTSPPLEALREAWLDAPDLAAQRRLAGEVQAQAMLDLPYIPLGQFFQPTAHRRTLSGMLQGPTLFWNLALAG